MSLKIERDGAEKTVKVKSDLGLTGIDMKGLAPKASVRPRVGVIKKKKPSGSDRESTGKRSNKSDRISVGEPVVAKEPEPVRPPSPPVEDSDDEPGAFDLLANPEKRLPETEPQSGGGIFGGGGWFNNNTGTDSDTDSSISTKSGKTNRSGNTELSNKSNENYYGTAGANYTPPPHQDTEEQYLTYEQRQQKKAYYLGLFDKLEKKGVRLHHRFTMDHDFSDIKNEYIRIKTQLEVEQSVQFGRKALMG